MAPTAEAPSAAPSGFLTGSPLLSDQPDPETPSGPENGPTLHFTVHGEAKSAGSKRAFRNPHTDRIILTETVKGSKQWQQAVRETVAEAFEGELITGPVAVTMTFYRPRPASHYGSGKNARHVKPSAPAFPSVRPDALKLARGVEDACTGILWRDDAQIIDGRQVKAWGEPARLELEVIRL